MAGEAVKAGVAPPQGRLYVGGAVLVVGWLCPLLVPLVLESDLAAEWKTTLSGLLLLGIPELFTLVAVAILGKPGFQHVKGMVFRLLRRLAPPDAVGLVRYRVGLAMFVVPILFGWISLYIPNLIPGFSDHSVVFAVVGDVMFVASLPVLGGEFWDKLRALFVHGARARFPEPAV